MKPPWMGGSPLTDEDAARGEGGWPVVGPSAQAAVEGWQIPHSLDGAEIAGIVESFAAAARRSLDAGFRVLEIHGAHGYLIHSFLSSVANRRNDSYGGDLAGRMRFALEVADSVRAAWPDELPLFYRISAVDGRDSGWTLDDAVVLSRELAARGSMSSIARPAALPARRRSGPLIPASRCAPGPSARPASRCPMPNASAAIPASRPWPSA